MELTSALVGAELRPHETVVTARQCMNYAAGVGDLNPFYFDDTRPDGISAPPMMAVALTWQITQRFPDFMDRDPFPKEWLGYGVHYRESLQWHRPMVAGDRLVIRGKIVAAVPHRSGTYVGMRYDAEDSGGGRVFTEHFGWVYRGIVCADSGRGADEIPQSPEIPQDTAPVWETEIPIDSQLAHVYDGCANIHNPIHTSRRFARAVGLPEPILHGTATLAMAVRELVNREARGDPGRLRVLDCRFTSMVLMGTSIRVQLLAKSNTPSATELFFQVLTPSGQKAISKGYTALARQ